MPSTCLTPPREELSNKENIRIFSLQKLVEVNDFNMTRIKFIWQRIWDIMKAYFGKVGCHNIGSVAMYAIDSLKQLGVKFLRVHRAHHILLNLSQQAEFSSFDYQKQFLSPFEKIYHEMPTHNQDLKEVILGCVIFMVQHSIKEIKSGWRIILNLVKTANEEGIAERV